MKTATSCVVCGGGISVRKKAMVAPFLARRIWNRSAFPIDLMECERCDFLFFNPRLDPEEEGLLYAKYRSAEYQEVRQSAEPWYTRRFNENLSSPDLLQSRREILSTLFQRYLRGREVRAVLDFGGDRGGLVRGLIPGATPYVYDISDVAAEPGVERAGNLAACRQREFDLVLNSNVLEHVGFPQVVLEQIKSVTSPKTMVFIEVPFESPFSRSILLRRIVQLGLLTATRPLVAKSLARPRGLYLMHEHVNFFGPKSLKALMTPAGWSIVASGDYHVGGPGGGGTMGWCLAQV